MRTWAGPSAAKPSLTDSMLYFGRSRTRSTGASRSLKGQEMRPKTATTTCDAAPRLSSPTADARIVDQFYREIREALPVVERVLAYRDGDVLSIWVIVNDISYDARMKLYELENDLVMRYEHPVLMFQTVWRQGRPLSDIYTFPTDSYDPSVDCRHAHSA